MKKRRLLSIVLSLCMVLALMPQMVFADETATYDLWQVGNKIYYAETGTCTDFTTAEGCTELPQGDHTYAYKLPYSGTYVLKTDITMTESKRQIHISTSDITLDLNGKVMTKYSGDRYILGIKANNATIQDSNGVGTINGKIDIEGINSSLTLNSGTIEEISCSGGTLYADGGTVSKADTNANNGTITQHTGTAGTTFTGNVSNGGSQCGTISGGIFYGEVYNGGNRDRTSTISNGVFYGKVFNYISGNITGGEFYGEVENTETITGGVFYDKVLNKSGTDYIANISGGVFYGGIVEQGGNINGQYHTVSFDLNGGDGSIPEQYFVGTDEAQALEPADPTKEGYDFTGWYMDKELTKLYDFGSNVTGDLNLYAGFELPTLTVPFTTTVIKEEGSLEPPRDTTFNLEVVDSHGNELSCDNVKITAESVTTNGAGSYDGKIAFTGKDYEILRMFANEKFVFVKQAEGDYPNWKVDDTVWCLSHSSAAELSEDETEPSPIVISKATVEESENGIFYNINEDEGTFDNISFTNKYNKQEENPAASESTTNGDSDNADKNAKTGDNTNLALWLALMLLSGAGITGVTALARRKRTNE
ncbi:MAG: InlB B-repeat-containing protein [Eubacteriales bacterium]|nr:InlB B-repeat-containing protein [Eubacteriales bacterium]